MPAMPTRPDVHSRTRWLHLFLILCCGLAMAGCRTPAGREAQRKGDEIVVCGRWFHTGTPVVLWTDPRGYDAYRVDRFFARPGEGEWKAIKEDLDTPNRYGSRRDILTDAQRERLDREGWTLPLLAEVVDQVVVHYDAAGTSRRAFEILHDHRGLSAHFLIDLDGTIYQTLDLKERAWHATKANSRSIGIEIANVGAVPVKNRRHIDGAYEERDGRYWLKGRDLRPARREPVVGPVQGQELIQYDFTPQQYEALERLLAALHRVLPRIELDYPRDESGELVRQTLADEQFDEFSGVVGHYHVSRQKVDPGPAFQWDRVLERSRRLAR